MTDTIANHMLFTDTTTLVEARDWLRDKVDDGTYCPCCTQFSKVYRRKITAHTAVVLIAMWRQARTDWVDVPALGLGHADEAKARYWGLIEPKPDEIRDDGSSRTGWWRLTVLGQSYVMGRAAVPKYARIYDGRCLGLDDSTMEYIAGALGTRFDYNELMAGI